jgi:hypothetical protein
VELEPLRARCDELAGAVERIGARRVDADERMITSGFWRAASRISSFGIGAIPLRDSQSTVNRTAARFRSR